MYVRVMRCLICSQVVLLSVEAYLCEMGFDDLIWQYLFDFGFGFDEFSAF